MTWMSMTDVVKEDLAASADDVTLGGGLVVNDTLSVGSTLTINGRDYGTNKILWSGGSYMHASQTTTLSEAITAQPHGVVLVWSEYTSGAAQDAGWSYFFIPKQRITSGNTGGGMNCSALHYGGSSTMAKYVYPKDTEIIGNALNTSSANNGSFVLRYVVGV